MHITIGELHELLGGKLRYGAMPPCAGEATVIGPIVTDSRTIAPDEVFWGLAGPRFNGAHFADEALMRGASGVVVAGRRVEPWAGRWSLEVDDSLDSLWRLAGWNRHRLSAPLVAVTGSVGKTTARRMIDALLSSRLCGATSPKNYNNHIGVPLSLLQLERWHRYAVVELGATGGGEIRRLAQLAQPHIGVVTQIAEAHLGLFGSQEAIADAKGELLAELPDDGQAVLNGDDLALRRMSKSCRASIRWFGRGSDVDVQARNVESRNGRLTFRVDAQRYELAVWGRHHLTAALAAIAVGRLFDFESKEIAAALAGFTGVPMRCEVNRMAGATIINDCYNSSPTAMRAALELLREIDAPGRRIVVAGDMADLGAAAPAWHQRIGGEVVSRCGAELLIACGEYAAETTSAAAISGMPRGKTRSCRDWQEALPILLDEVRSGDVVLVKGARAMGMERLVESLKTRAATTAAA